MKLFVGRTQGNALIAPKASFLSWFIPPLALLLLFLVVWELLIYWLRVPPFFIPSPRLVFRAAFENRAQLAQGFLTTGMAACLGFLTSLIAGFCASILFCQSVWIRRSFFPYAIFLQTVPIVAIAPIIITWFGYGIISVIVVSFIISLFPIIANGTAGMTMIDPKLLELFEFYRASRWQILWKLRVPHAVPQLVTGAKTSSGLSVIGAIVGELSAGFSNDWFGLGYLVLQTSGNLKTSYLYAVVFSSTLLGLVIFGLVSLIGDLLVRRWKTGS